MEHGKELLLQAVSVILFCIAITGLFHQARAYAKIVKAVKDCYSQQQVLYEQGAVNEFDLVGASGNCCSYAQLITSLLGPLEYDIEINHHLISKYEHTVDQIEDYPIAKTDYSKSYAYDQQGIVTRIIYTSITGG